MKNVVFAAALVLSLACSSSMATATLISYSDRATFELQGAIAYNYGYEDFGTGYSFPGNPWTSHGVTYTTGRNLIVGTGTGFPISNVFIDIFLTPLTANIETGPQYDMFGLDLSYLRSFSLLTFTAYTNLDTYVFSGLSVPNVGSAMDFYGFIAGSEEYFTGFRLDAAGGGSGPAIDNVTLGSASQGATIPEPASLLLLGAGLSSLVLMRKRRRQAK